MGSVPLYRIKDWSKIYENAESRKLRRMTWVPMPNKHDGKGYRRMVAEAERCELFSAWHLMVQVASKCPVRGTLSDGDGPLTATDLFYKTGFPEHVFELAFEFFSDPRIGWLDKNIEISAESPSLREIPPASPEMPGESPGTSGRNRTEQNRTEQNDIKDQAPAGMPVGLFDQQVEEKKAKPPAFEINGQPIPGSFWGRVVAKCGGDRHLAGRVFFRARDAENIIAWISKGMSGDRYAFMPSKEESDDPTGVQAWVDKNISLIKRQDKPSREMSGIGDLLADMGVR